jgi:hypothetical protein
MDILYKILFEVRLLHEFYLTNSNGVSIFNGNPQQRTDFLRERFSRDERNIGSDLFYQVPEPAAITFRNLHLRLLPTYAGFKVAVEVKQVALPGPLIGFQPLVPLPDNLCLPIQILRKGHDVDQVTNTRMLRNISSAFYFSNENIPGAKTHPFLTENITPFIFGFPYEQGQLALHGPSDVRSFFIDELDTDQWLPITTPAPSGGYASENDRLLVKPDFYYSFLPGDDINEATFKLKDNTNALVATINAKNATGNFQRVALSFDVLKLNTIPENPAAANLVYTLEVTGNGGYNKTHRLIFLRDISSDIRNTWGLVNICNKTADAQFQLTDAAGRLMTRLNPDNTVNTAPPIFEIWVKSRLPFWRYSNDNPSFELQAAPHIGLLRKEGKKLISLQPYALSYTPTLMGIAYRPNPKLFDTLKTEGRRVYADITVPESEMFPLGP